jgi:hypothetical protein
VALIATSAPHVLIWSLDLVTPWGVAAALLVVITGSMIGLHRWSTGSGWAPAHTAAAGCGALLTYVWRGFLQPPLIETSRGIDVSSDVVFGAIGIALVAWVARSVGVRARPEPRARART